MKRREDIIAKNIAKEFISGLSIIELAKKFNCSGSTIWHRLREIKIEVPYRRKHHFNEHVFKKCSSSKKAYWLGFLMADGNIASELGRYRLTLVLQEKDINHLEKFKKFLNCKKKLEKKISKPEFCNSTCYRLVVDSRKMIGNLSQYGIIPRKTAKEQIKNIPREYIRDFIRGYFDGDGCITSTRTSPASFSITSGNKLFMEKMQEILVKTCELNFTKLGKATPKRTDGTRSLSWTINYGGRRQTRRIFNYLYGNSNVCLDRKFRRFKELVA